MPSHRKYQKIERYQTWWNREIVLYRGDDIIDQGTIKEIAERRGVRKDTIYFYTMPTAGRRADRRKIGGMRAIVV